MRLFIFGMGYSSQAVARALQRTHDGVVISGTHRGENVVAGLHYFDGTAPGPSLDANLRTSTHVLISIPPDENGDPVLRHHQRTLDAAVNLKWLGYFSTVGVYGDAGGEWIDESAATNPVNLRSQQRVAAEQAWRNYAALRGVPLTILRLAGIYGPGRSALDKVRDGSAKRIIKAGQVFNRIHVEDIGRVTALAAERQLGGIFNLADDEPAPPQDVVTYAAKLLGLTPPAAVVFERADMTAMARSFYADNKRVSNKAIKAALRMELGYPNYRAGLDAIFKGVGDG